MFRAFDKDNDSNVSMEEWVYGLSVFLRGNFEERIHCKYTRGPVAEKRHNYAFVFAQLFFYHLTLFVLLLAICAGIYIELNV